jgi:co-chaperonin GroES (HSP10)
MSKILNGAIELDTRPFPTKTWTPAGHLCCGHQLQIVKTKGGIVLPNGRPFEKQYETSRVKIVAIGPDVTKCKVGDIVLLSDTAPAEIVTHKDQVTLLFSQDHFLGVEDA